MKKMRSKKETTLRRRLILIRSQLNMHVLSVGKNSIKNIDLWNMSLTYTQRERYIHFVKKH